MTTPITKTALLFLGLSYAVAAVGFVLAFAPYGYGFVTVVTSAVGVILSGKASHLGAEQAAKWAARANMGVILTYVLYMVTWMPTSTVDHQFEAQIIETGVLADQGVFSDKEQAAGDIHGIRMNVAPCGHEWVFRVTGKANDHLGVYVPEEKTRECLNALPGTGTLTLDIQEERRAINQEAKGFRVLGIGPCALTVADGGAAIQADACAEWF